MSTNAGTPYLAPVSASALPSSLSAAALVTAAASSVTRDNEREDKRTKQNEDADLADVPPLSIGVLTEYDDKVEALKLIADSIAQQRQMASLHLIFHPYCIPFAAFGAAAAWHGALWARPDDLGSRLMLASAVIMTYLLAIRWLTSGYLSLAEGLGWNWLLASHPSSSPTADKPHGWASITTPRSSRSPSPTTASADSRSDPKNAPTDLVIGARYGDRLIGALVLRLEPPASAGHQRTGSSFSKRHRGRSSSLRGGTGLVRAWTTELRYRRKGIGGDLLLEAVRVTRERCGRDAQVGFAREHANAGRVLPKVFAGIWRRSEIKAARALEATLAEWEAGRRRR